MKAFVTGATGLLGGSLVRELVTQGHEVTGLVRSTEKASRLFGNSPVRFLPGDMTDVDAFSPHLKGIDVVFHTAGYFRETYTPGLHWDNLQRINVDSTIHLLTACERAEVSKVIYVSSASVIGAKPDGSPGDESAPPDQHTHDNLYARSKLMAEEAVTHFRKTHALPVVSILPTGLYGPYDAAPTPAGQFVIDYIKGKMPMIPPGAFSVVDARDVAQGMITAAQRAPGGERYIMTNCLVTLRELMMLISAASKAPLPRITLSDGMAMAMAALTEGIAKITRGQPMMPRAAVRLLIARRDLDGSKGVRELGFTTRPFETTITDTVRWFADNAYL